MRVFRMPCDERGMYCLDGKSMPDWILVYNSCMMI
jgi:hypothetical protein